MYRMTREFFTSGIPEAAKHVVLDNPVCEYYTWDEAGKPYAKCFGGKRSKPDSYYRFANAERRELHIDNWIGNLTASANNKAARKAELNKPHTLKVGDILYTSWGYDQTNVDFYQILKLKGKTMCTLQEIGGKTIDDPGAPCTHVVAVPDSFTGEPMSKRINGDNCIRMASYASASKWDGEPKYQTGWGWGH